MTKKQLVTWLVDNGVEAEGKDTASYGYLITKVKEEEFTYRNQRRAHIAAINAFLEEQK